MPAFFTRSATVGILPKNKKRETRKIEKGSIINYVSYTALKGIVTLTNTDGDVYTMDGSAVVLKDVKGKIQYPTKVRLAVPYFSQLDNRLNPTVTCNITCVAMCLRFLGVQGNGDGQLEDQLNLWLTANELDRYNHEHLRLIFIDKGIKNIFKTNSNIEEIKEHLARGYPVIIAGWFTAAGHIVTAVGYDENGLLVHDPNGEWYDWGYEVNDDRNGHTAGQFVHYSYKLINRLCNDSGIWAHFPSRN